MRQYFTLLFLLSMLHCQAQEEMPDENLMLVQMPQTEVRMLSSGQVGVTYKLYISLPYDFDSTKSYPVIFLLDPEYSFAIAKNITDHLSERNDLEDVMLVGIGYAVDHYRLNRTRDYTPAFTLDGGYGEEMQRYSGGGPKFLDFIEQELIPFVEQNYAQAKSKTLVGHSYGGLFTTWTMLSRPHIFDRYIAVSPSLWYNDKMLFDQLSDFTKTHPDLQERAFFTVGTMEINNRWNMVQDLRNFTDQMQTAQLPGLDFRVTFLENETHNTVFPRAFSDGLRYVFGLR